MRVFVIGARKQKSWAGVRLRAKSRFGRRGRKIGWTEYPIDFKIIGKLSRSGSRVWQYRSGLLTWTGSADH